jgi:phosphate transport system protein
MGALCEDAIACAVKALLNSDMKLAKSAMNKEKEIDQKERDIETLCMKLLLQQQPVAKDLRLISSALKMITDMERIGDQAADIAEVVTFIDLSESISSVHISDMAVAVIHMVTQSIDAFVKRDLKLANDVIAYDDVVDGLFMKTKKDLIDLIASDIKNGEKALDILMIAKYLERIGDHAALIAEWVVFSITGTHINP